MKVLAVLAFIIAAIYAKTITLPVTQDFAVVNPRSGTIIARTPKLSLFNNGITSSIVYFGVDMNPLISEASITSNAPVPTIIEAAKLIIKNYTMVGSFGSDPVTINFSYLNPGQVWTEDAVTLGTTPSVRGALGAVTFTSTSVTVIDVTQFVVESLSTPYQSGLFGFQVGQPGGPVEITSHRVDPNAVVVEVTYTKWISGETAAPTTTAPSTTAAPAPTTAAPSTAAPTTAAPSTIPPAPSTAAPNTAAPTTSAPTQNNCWTCGAGYAHWYDLGMPEPKDPCACIQIPSVPPTSPGPQASTAPTAVPQTSSPKSDERNGSEKLYASALLFVVSTLVLML